MRSMSFGTYWQRRQTLSNVERYVTVPVERDPGHPYAIRQVRVRFRPADDSPATAAARPIRGVLLDARLVVRPRIPIENEGKNVR